MSTAFAAIDDASDPARDIIIPQKEEGKDETSKGMDVDANVPGANDVVHNPRRGVREPF